VLTRCYLRVGARVREVFKVAPHREKDEFARRFLSPVPVSVSSAFTCGSRVPPGKGKKTQPFYENRGGGGPNFNDGTSGRTSRRRSHRGSSAVGDSARFQKGAGQLRTPV